MQIDGNKFHVVNYPRLFWSQAIVSHRLLLSYIHVLNVGDAANFVQKKKEFVGVRKPSLYLRFFKLSRLCIDFRGAKMYTIHDTLFR